MGSDRAGIIAAQVALVACLSATGGLGLKSAFVSWGFAPAVVLAALAGAAVPYFARRAKIPFPLSTGVSMVALLVVGTVLSYVAPWRILDFAFDIVASWRRILTIAAPVDPQSSLIAVPIVLAWVGATIGAELSIRTNRVALPLVGPLLTAVGAILFGLSDRVLSLWIAVAFFLFATVFIALRSRTHWLWTAEKGATHHGRRLLVASALVALAIAAAPTVAEAVFGLDDNDRFTFRQQVDPPFDLTRLSSPLSELKGSLPTADMTEDGDRGDVVFQMSGDPVTRMRLAVLDDYDGRIWLINRNSDGADFIRAGTQFPPPDPINQGEEVDHSIEIVDLAESWLPTGGTATGLEITSAVQIGGVEPVELIRLDRTTGNLLIRPRLRSVEGLAYDVSSVPPVESTDFALDESSSLRVMTSARNTAVPEVPSSITNLARESMLDAEGPFARVSGLQTFLGDQTYDVEQTPGHLLIQLATLAERNPMVGFDEQFAALMATTLRSAGIPARVAVGFVPGEDELAQLSTGAQIDVYSTDIEAWVEVPFEDHGWVAFDAGPPDDQTDEVEDGTSEAQAQSVSANPPPPVSSTTSTTIAPAEEEEPEPDELEQESGGVPVFVLASAIALSVPLLIVGLFSGLVLLLKRRRRAKRRHAASAAEQIHGAYCEYLDRSVDVGIEVAAGSTPRSAIGTVAEESFDPVSRSGSLIVLVEDAAFAPGEPDAEDVAEAWEHSAELADRLGADLSRSERAKAAISLRSFRSKADS